MSDLDAPMMEEWDDLVDREGVLEDQTGPVQMVRAMTEHGIDESLTVYDPEEIEGIADLDDRDDQEFMSARLAMIARSAGMVRGHK